MNNKNILINLIELANNKNKIDFANLCKNIFKSKDDFDLFFNNIDLEFLKKESNNYYNFYNYIIYTRKELKYEDVDNSQNIEKDYNYPLETFEYIGFNKINYKDSYKLASLFHENKKKIINKL